MANQNQTKNVLISEEMQLKKELLGIALEPNLASKDKGTDITLCCCSSCGGGGSASVESEEEIKL